MTTLTISLPELRAHAEDLRVLWYDHVLGHYYWRAERRSPWHLCAMDAEELLPLCPPDGSERTIRIETITLPVADEDAEAIWGDPHVDVVAVLYRGERRSVMRCYGPLEGSFRRRRMDRDIAYEEWSDVLEDII